MNDQAAFFSGIRECIARNELAAGMEQLRVFFENCPQLDKIIHQSDRFQNIRQQIRLGLISQSEASLTQNPLHAGLLDVLDELEEQGKTPAFRAEIERAISVINSKNVVIGSTISAGGHVQIGDRNETHYHYADSNTQNQNMKEPSKAIWLSVLIAAFGVAIGFLGELMPDSFKTKIETWSTAIFGMSYLKIWLISTALVVAVFLVLVWKEALKDDNPAQTPPANIRKVKQGKKSVYIEKNDGPINIK